MTAAHDDHGTNAIAVRRHRALHAALVPAAETVGGGADGLRRHDPVRALAHALNAPTEERAFANAAAEGIFSLMMPIAALVIGDAVLGAEVRGGTFHFTWLSPVPRWQIVIGRWIGGVIVALVTITPATALAAVVAGAPSSARPAAIAAAVGSMSYIAVFIAIGCLTKRTAVWSLAFVFLIERLLGAALTGIAQLSPMWESRAIFVGLLDDPPTASSATASPTARPRSCASPSSPWWRWWWPAGG